MSKSKQKRQARREAMADGALYVADSRKSFRKTCTDFLRLRSSMKLNLWRAWQDTKGRYRRSVLGPYWLTMATFTFIFGYSLLAGILFKRDLTEFLGYIAAGIVTWQFISGNLVEGSKIFVANLSEINSARVNFLDFPFKLLLRGFITFLHGLPIVLIVIYFTDGFTMYTPFFLLGLTIMALTLFPLSIALGTLAARFRDIEQVVAMIVQFFFYMTPIIWKTETLGTGMGRWLALANPFYYELTIVREPLLGVPVPLNIWLGAVVVMILAWIFSLIIYTRFRQRIPFWV